MPRRGRTTIVTILAALVSLVSATEFVHRASQPEPDFVTRYAAGIAVSRGSSPYNRTVMEPIEVGLTPAATQHRFNDPPPTALLFRVIATIPFRTAQLAWACLSIAAALFCLWRTFSLIGIPVRGLPAASLTIAAALTFAPVRYGLSAGQIDAVVGALVLIAFTVKNPVIGGILQSIATMKPQTAALVSVGGLKRHLARFFCGMTIGYVGIVVLTLVVGSAGWQRWLHVARDASHHHGPVAIAVAILIGIGLLALTARAYACLCRFGVEPALAALGCGACLNAVVSPFVFSNLWSDVLFMVPLTLASHALTRTRMSEVALGVVAGIFFLDGNFAVTAISGVKHAALPIGLGLLLATAATVAFPARRLAIFTAFVVNAAVTIPAFGPVAHRWFTVTAAAILLVMLSALLSDGGVRARLVPASS